MPDGWSKPRDLAKLADSRAAFDFAIPVGELPGMPADLAAAGEPLSAKLRFGRERGLPVAEVSVQGTVTLVCQRCLGPMRLAIAAESKVAVVDTPARAETVPEEWETVLAEDGALALAALVAEEVLLTLPAVPRHSERERCEPPGEVVPEVTAASAGHEEEPQRPFSDLRALLKGGKRDE
jgi:uncharacterized protein